jgi:glutamyl-Q tRNA(Asp) synthetase
MIKERFAPSPTGLLHLGHAFSAITAYNAAYSANGQFYIRIEDIDTQRCKDEFVQAIFEDLKWLGLSWMPEVIYQSNRMGAYNMALQKLIDLGLCYPCTCTRKDIKAALSAPQEGVDKSPSVYPNICRDKNFDTAQDQYAIRLNMEKAIEALGAKKLDLIYIEQSIEGKKHNAVDPNYLIDQIGDIVLARKDIGTSYHIAVVVDDAYQNFTHVTRGADIKPETPIHCLLQALLGYSTPIYHHHKLIRDTEGLRLAKRSDSKAIRKFRDEGYAPEDIYQMIGLAPL